MTGSRPLSMMSLVLGIVLTVAGCPSSPQPTVTVFPSTATIPVGQTQQLTATSTDASDISFNWASDDPGVASVNSTGRVTGVAEGTAVITATGSHSNRTGSATITVQPPAEGEGEGEGEGEVVPGEMVYVPAGSFEMGDPWGEGSSAELPVHTVTLSAYQIGKYEVTNQEYADILNWANARGYLTTASSNTATAYAQELLDVDDTDCQIGYSGGQFVVESRDGYSMADHPIVVVSWYGAAAYCNWLSESQGLQPCYDTSTWTCDFSNNGYHLPTEAQWERAAAWNGSSHFRYGNGSDSISCSTANFYDGGYCNPLGLSSSPYTSPVGYYSGAPSPAGCYDMSGNVWEWCDDWWYRVYTSSSVTDPEGPSSGSYRVARGGGWYNYGLDCRSAYRSADDPSCAGRGIGFRLAR